jgi:hypothetical protein
MSWDPILLNPYQKVRLSTRLFPYRPNGAGVLIGAYTGQLPRVVPVADGASMGRRFLAKATEAASEHGPDFSQKNDLYLLLRSTEEAS